MISKTGLHMIRALVALSKIPPDTCIGAAALADEIDAPRNYLGKLLNTLSRQGLITAQKGGNGGVKLARPANEISLFEVVEPFEGVSRWEECFLGHKVCSDETPCVAHASWKPIREAYLAFLRTKTIADLVTDPSVEDSFPLGPTNP